MKSQSWYDFEPISVICRLTLRLMPYLFSSAGVLNQNENFYGAHGRPLFYPIRMPIDQRRDSMGMKMFNFSKGFTVFEKG